MESSPNEFIQKHIFDARYTPLLRDETATKNTRRLLNTPNRQQPSQISIRPLTPTEERIVSRCVARIIPHLDSLRNDECDDGIVSIVLCHLFELWAVGFVGAEGVADVWEGVLRIDD